MSQTVEALYRHEGDAIDFTTVSAVSRGEIIQLPDGRAAWSSQGIAAADTDGCHVSGVVRVLKTASINILAGGDVWWDHSANTATYKKNGDRDFYLGCAVSDSLAASTEVDVALNVRSRHTIDMLKDDPFDTIVVLTAGTVQTLPRGGAVELTFSATAEAQKVDMLSVDGVAVGANGIAEFIVEIADDGDASALDINWGIANGTHATDADSITESCFFHTDGNVVDILAESDDGTTEVAATDTTVNYTLGSRHEYWIDFRNPADVQLYVDGVNVLPNTTFVLTAATGPLKLLFHMEKTSDDTTADVIVSKARMRTAQV